MIGVNIRSDGDFSKTKKDITRMNTVLKNVRTGKSFNLNEYAERGLDALKRNTPVDTGKTSESWYYKITEEPGRIKLQYCNSNVNDGYPIAVLLQYGHGTRNGGWVEGRDYINPAIQPIFDGIVNDMWREVTQ